jgi:MoxR-like ATPase/CTP:molybdopterin cytidylyltransferase MocA
VTRVCGLLLAAGAGRRLGLPKALLRGADDEPVLVTTVDRLVKGGCDEVVVVLGAQAEEAHALLTEESGRWPAGAVRAVVADDWDHGMAASLATGLWAISGSDPEPDAVLVHLVDLPDVTAEVVARVVAAWRESGASPQGLVRATYAGEPGHPVLLGHDHQVGLAASVGAALQQPGPVDYGARAYLADRRVHLVDCDDLATGRDVDRPDDLVATEQKTPVASPDELARRMAATGYLCDDALATVGFLAIDLSRPLLLEGEPGTGKTAWAEALAQGLSLPLVRLQCYEGIDASQALYDWDFPRQILHLRAVESTASSQDVSEVEDSLFSERFLLSRPLLRALRESPAVLLIDEIDRADDEFEAFLLEMLSTFQVSIPELGTVAAAVPPLVVLTSNRTRELHDALKRRCLYHWIDHPGLEREVAIVRSRAPEVSERLAEQVVTVVQRLRSAELLKSPGVAETLDWARALDRLGARELDVETAARTLGAVVKHREDAERVRASLERMLA